MTDLLGIVDTLQAGVPGSDSLEVRSRSDRFIDQAVERRQTLERQLEMDDEFLAPLRRQLAARDLIATRIGPDRPRWFDAAPTNPAVH